MPKDRFSHDTTFVHHRPAGRPLDARPKQKLLFLVRDPRDVAVSFYHHVQRRASAREAKSPSISEFVLHERYGAVLGKPTWMKSVVIGP